MRRVLPVLAAVAAMSFLGATGVAAAETAGQQAIGYKVIDAWSLAYIDGRPTVLPHMEDDTVEVKCLHGDQMNHWWYDPKLVAESFELVDGTGIQVQPHFTGTPETLEITITCRRG